MNQLIKELAQSAGYGSERWNSTEDVEQFMEKFAELIVQESIKEILKWKIEPFPFDEDTAVWILQQHFNMEQ